MRNSPITHLTQNQIQMLLNGIKANTMIGLRDALIIGLALGTGLSELALIKLEVTDLHHQLDGDPAVRVPDGSERLVPYFDAWLPEALNVWLEKTHLTEGLVFRGLKRGGRLSGSDAALTPRAIQMVMKKYPVNRSDGGSDYWTILDLRRTYARRLYKHGVSFETIQALLGQGTRRTTLEYIGPPDTGRLDDLDLPLEVEELRRGYRELRYERG
jgi:site-specific recombinase XerD